MKKNVTVNLFGSLYAIDEDAYELLKNYEDNLRSSFADRQKADEMVNHIEAHIATQFDELKRSGVEAITVEHVEQIIRSLDSTEGIRENSAEEGTASTDSVEVPTGDVPVRKRLYRNPNDVVLSGSLSGLACYFGGSPLAWRVAMLVLFCLSCGTALLAYIVLWIVVPLARTPAELLAMQGKPLTPNNLGAEVVYQMKREKDGARLGEEPASPMQRLCSGMLKGGTWVLKIVFYLLVAVMVALFLVFVLSFLMPFGAGLFTLPFVSFSYWDELPLWMHDGTYTFFPWPDGWVIGAAVVFLFVSVYCLIHWLRRQDGRGRRMGVGQRIFWLVLWLMSFFIVASSVYWIVEVID